MSSSNTVLSSGQKPIAPKSRLKVSGVDNTVTSSTTNGSQKRSSKKAFHHPTLGYAIPPPVPAKVARRNARERNRVKQVNSGFEILRTHIPSAVKHKKMSKVDTLRHAVEYIQSLQRMLTGNNDDEDSDESDDCENKKITSLLAYTQENFDLEKHGVKKEGFSPASQNQPMTYPLTPRTPGSAHDEFNGYGNESGYETCSYYSSASTVNLLSPTNQHNNQYTSVGSAYHAQQQPQQQLSENVASAAEVVTEPSFHQQQNHHRYNFVSLEPNSEEDELLDAIASWQDD